MQGLASKQYIFRSCNIYFECYAFWWTCFHTSMRKTKTEMLKGLSTLRTFSLVIFKRHHGNEGVNLSIFSTRAITCVRVFYHALKIFYINLCMYVCLSVILRHAQFWTCYRGFDKNLFSFFSWLYQSLVISYLSWQPIRDKKKKKKKNKQKTKNKAISFYLTFELSAGQYVCIIKPIVSLSLISLLLWNWSDHVLLSFDSGL